VWNRRGCLIRSECSAAQTPTELPRRPLLRPLSLFLCDACPWPVTTEDATTRRPRTIGPAGRVPAPNTLSVHRESAEYVTVFRSRHHMRLDIMPYVALQMSSRACCGGFAVVVESASHLGGDYWPALGGVPAFSFLTDRATAPRMSATRPPTGLSVRALRRPLPARTQPVTTGLIRSEADDRYVFEDAGTVAANRYQSNLRVSTIIEARMTNSRPAPSTIALSSLSSRPYSVA
jgi:hypothetical protein